MELSRKRRKELKKLRAAAYEIIENQRVLLGQAGDVARKAGHHAAEIGRENVAPAVRDAYENRVVPGVSAVAEGARDKINDVAPSISSALASAIAVLEVAKDPRVREALKRANSAGTQLGKKVGIVPSKPTPGPGRYILLGVGLVVAAGVAYAAWQTLRADDELWVADEDDTTETAIPAADA
jgi:hypothetical protein